MAYAIISLGGKQYRVREGERLLVDRVPHDEGASFTPDVVFLGGDGDAKIGAGEAKGTTVTARVARHVLGEKIVVGKHRQRTGFRKRNGHRSRLSQIEIESIGGKKASRSSGAKKTQKKAEKQEEKQA